MPRIQIVTDSGARYSNPRLMRHFPITILPNIITMAGKQFREGIDMDPEAAFAQMAQMAQPPTITPPSERDYTEVFLRLAPVCDAIISVHPSRKLSQSWQNGRMAAQAVSSDCEIAIIDSQTMCAGQGMLIRVAAQAAQAAADIETAIQQVRQAVDRIYSVYCVRDTRFLRANGIMSTSHAILSSQLGIMPFLSLEGGEILIIEKVRDSSQMIERLVEFMSEFNALEDALVLQAQEQITEQTRLLHEVLALDFPGQHFPFTMYSTSMACYLGFAASGMAVLEKADEDDFEF
ncbi:MAG: DegV family EDD domain-containing protein [Chloroflexi bacterium]|nr:DegV family EDD domain-containing protein [Chloroflexota bacterium]MCY3581511.1 DegV family EDD domain-containing protein [Chloroflexota bacterium]MCY3716557.1 DegV family EDD domain-containing protein [Chloroflexota bacterium]MDE2651666.1 DegV family EDD domain-containing protein [Chloroflexota bacterium]